MGAIFLGGGAIKIFSAGRGTHPISTVRGILISYLALSEKATINKMLTFEYRVSVYFW